MARKYLGLTLVCGDWLPGNCVILAEIFSKLENTYSFRVDRSHFLRQHFTYEYFPIKGKSRWIGLGWREHLRSVMRLMGHRKTFRCRLDKLFPFFNRQFEAIRFVKFNSSFVKVVQQPFTRQILLCPTLFDMSKLSIYQRAGSFRSFI